MSISKQSWSYTSAPITRSLVLFFFFFGLITIAEIDGRQLAMIGSSRESRRSNWQPCSKLEMNCQSRISLPRDTCLASPCWLTLRLFWSKTVEAVMMLRTLSITYFSQMGLLGKKRKMLSPGLKPHSIHLCNCQTVSLCILKSRNKPMQSIKWDQLLIFVVEFRRGKYASTDIYIRIMLEYFY